MATRRVLAGVLTAILILVSASVVSAQPQTEKVQPVDVYLRSARIALATNPPEYGRAQSNLETARLHYPENYEVHLLLGTVWAEKDEIDSMVAEYALARKYAADKDWQKKAKDLDKVLDSKWLDRFNRGVNLLGQSDSASDVADTITDTTKVDSLRHVVVQIREMAAEALRHCTLLKPSDFRAYATRGIVYQRIGQNESALGDFTRAESLFHRVELKDSTTNWYDTTVFFTGAGEKTEAFKQYEAKYKKLTEEQRIRYNNLMRSLGGAYYEDQDWKKCIVINRRYLGLFPKDINSILTLADCFSRLQLDEEAYKWQEMTVQEDPGNKDTWYNLGIFYYNTAIRLQDSIAAYTKARERGRDDSAAKVARLGFIKQPLENFSKAIPRFKKVVELDEKDQETWKLLAICYYSVASLAMDDQLADDKAQQSEILGRVWLTITGKDSSFDQHGIWLDTEKYLEKALAMFPDDMALCKMLKVTYAQLNKVDKLRELASKCP